MRFLLSSSTDRTLTVPRTHNRFGDRSFTVAGPRLWNSLPISLRQMTSYGQFRRYLKAHLCGFLANVNVLRYVCYMRSQFRLSSVCLSSVCLSSVTLVHPTQAVELFGNFFSPYDSPGTLLFWCQKSWVGDALFPLKFAFKVTHPFKTAKFRQISAHSATTVIASEKSLISTYRKSTTRFPTSHR